MQGEDSHVNSLYWACAELFFLRFSPRTIRMSPKRDTLHILTRDDAIYLNNYVVACIFVGFAFV